MKKHTQTQSRISYFYLTMNISVFVNACQIVSWLYTTSLSCLRTLLKSHLLHKLRSTNSIILYTSIPVLWKITVKCIAHIQKPPQSSTCKKVIYRISLQTIFRVKIFLCDIAIEGFTRGYLRLKTNCNLVADSGKSLSRGLQTLVACTKELFIIKKHTRLTHAFRTNPSLPKS